MKTQSLQFKRNATSALNDEQLQQALAHAKTGFIAKRAEAVAALPEWQAIREEAKTIKNHVLDHLDEYLLSYESAVQARGGQVHWAETSADATQIIVQICQENNAKNVIKGKSMVSEEAELNDALKRVGIETVETDLGEYIIQLAEEPPSHIIAPAIHKTKQQVSDLFHDHHQQYGLHKKLDSRVDLVNEARQVLRDKFLNADVGITGANFLVAETGQHVLVTNEGNGDLSSLIPRTHIVIAGIEKVVPSLEDASCLLRLLARSATGQHFSNYTSFMGGPKQPEDPDGPENFHVVLVDNKRTEMYGSELRDMLRCFRCGACLNHCPVYGSVGGHSYGWVYPGPMGSVVTPVMVGIENAPDLAHACTLNGRCAQVCPMSIPLPDLLRKHRQTTFEKALQSPSARYGISLWAWVARKPFVYRCVTSLAAKVLNAVGSKNGFIQKMPFASAWTKSRNMPAPEVGATFMSRYKQQKS